MTTIPVDLKKAACLVSKSRKRWLFSSQLSFSATRDTNKPEWDFQKSHLHTIGKMHENDPLWHRPPGSRLWFYHQIWKHHQAINCPRLAHHSLRGRKSSSGGFQRWTQTHRRDVNGAIYRRYVAGMEFRCVLQKSETRVCVHDVLKRGKKRKQEERDKHGQQIDCKCGRKTLGSKMRTYSLRTRDSRTRGGEENRAICMWLEEVLAACMTTTMNYKI